MDGLVTLLSLYGLFILSLAAHFPILAVLTDCGAVCCAVNYNTSLQYTITVRFNRKRITCIFDCIGIKPEDLNTLLYCHTATRSGPTVWHFKSVSLRCHTEYWWDVTLLFSSTSCRTNPFKFTFKDIIAIKEILFLLIKVEDINGFNK